MDVAQIITQFQPTEMLYSFLLLGIVLGAGLGFFGGVFGLGGGIIAIPVLVLGLGMDQTLAQGTALAMMVPNLIIAWWRYRRQAVAGPEQGAVPLVVLIALMGVSTLVTHYAAGLAQGMDQALLHLAFAGFLMTVGVRQLCGLRPGGATRPQATAPRRRLPTRLIPLVGVASGGCMGLLGVGGGLVATPLLTGFFGLGQRAAQGVALALVSPSAAVALARYAGAQRVDWPVGVAMALGGMITVSAGVALAHAVPERHLKALFGAMLIGTGVVLVFEKSGVPLF